MKWFKRKLRQWVFETDDDGPEGIPVAKASRGRGLVAGNSRTLDCRGMSFTVYHATGGTILEYSHYDEKTDRHHQRLHIIPSDQDMGQGIAHIITLEMLRS